MIRRTLLRSLIAAPALAPLLYLGMRWKLPHTPQAAALCDNMTALYLTVTMLVAIVALAFLRHPQEH